MSGPGATRTSGDVRLVVAFEGCSGHQTRLIRAARFMRAPPKTRYAGDGFYCRALIRLNSASARSNLWLKSHIASRISRNVADVLARSARPYAKMLLFRRYPMILGSEIL